MDMRHLDEGTIHAWLDGALDEATERKAEEHAARCTECAVAVADARGLIAASSRILTALDDVPAGVLPRGSRAMPAPPRRWATWSVRIAASVAVVVTGTLVVMRGGRPHLAEQTAGKDRVQLPPGVTLSVTPAVMPETSAVAARGGPAEADKKANAEEKTRLDSSTQPRDALFASKPAASANENAPATEPAAAPQPANAVSGGAPAAPAPAAASATQSAAAPVPMLVAKRSEPDTAAAKELAANVATKAPKMKVEQGPPSASGTQMTDMTRATLLPGMRLVSEQQGVEEARVVTRRVYEVRPGLEVTLASFAPASADGRADAGVSQDNDSAPRRQARARAQSDEAPGVNSIEWTDSTGTQFTLSGPLPLDSLRLLRSRLPQIRQR